jgi:hypothetical protein
MHNYYDVPECIPPFGLSDHNTVTVGAKVRKNRGQSSKFVYKRDKRASQRAALGRYLCAIDWSVLFHPDHKCQYMFNTLHKVIHTGLDLLMPIRRVRVNTADAPWMTDHLKTLILKRQKAFLELGVESQQFKFYRKLVNRKRKSCKASFYKSNIIIIIII